MSYTSVGQRHDWGPVIDRNGKMRCFVLSSPGELQEMFERLYGDISTSCVIPPEYIRDVSDDQESDEELTIEEIISSFEWDDDE